MNNLHCPDNLQWIEKHLKYQLAQNRVFSNQGLDFTRETQNYFIGSATAQ